MPPKKRQSLTNRTQNCLRDRSQANARMRRLRNQDEENRELDLDPLEASTGYWMPRKARAGQFSAPRRRRAKRLAAKALQNESLTDSDVKIVTASIGGHTPQSARTGQTGENQIEPQTSSSSTIPVELLLLGPKEAPFFCHYCPHSHEAAEEVKHHTLVQHSASAAVILNSLGQHTTPIVDVTFFCVRETCLRSSTNCSSHESHLIKCCHKQPYLSYREKERLASSLQFIIKFQTSRKIRAVPLFREFVLRFFRTYDIPCSTPDSNTAILSDQSVHCQERLEDNSSISQPSDQRWNDSGAHLTDPGTKPTIPAVGTEDRHWSSSSESAVATAEDTVSQNVVADKEKEKTCNTPETLSSSCSSQLVVSNAVGDAAHKMTTVDSGREEVSNSPQTQTFQSNDCMIKSLQPQIDLTKRNHEKSIVAQETSSELPIGEHHRDSQHEKSIVAQETSSELPMEEIDNDPYHEKSIVAQETSSELLVERRSSDSSHGKSIITNRISSEQLIGECDSDSREGCHPSSSIPLTEVEVKKEPLFCRHCPYTHVAIQALKRHLLEEHPISAAVMLNSFSEEAYQMPDVTFFCVRETCQHWTAICYVHEDHLMACCLPFADLSRDERERLASSINYLLKFHASHGLKTTAAFRGFVSSFFRANTWVCSSPDSDQVAMLLDQSSHCQEMNEDDSHDDQCHKDQSSHCQEMNKDDSHDDQCHKDQSSHCQEMNEDDSHDDQCHKDQSSHCQEMNEDDSHDDQCQKDQSSHCQEMNGDDSHDDQCHKDQSSHCQEMNGDDSHDDQCQKDQSSHCQEMNEDDSHDDQCQKDSAMLPASSSRDSAMPPASSSRERQELEAVLPPHHLSSFSHEPAVASADCNATSNDLWKDVKVEATEETPILSLEGEDRPSPQPQPSHTRNQMLETKWRQKVLCHEICANPSLLEAFDVKDEDSEICANPSTSQAFDVTEEDSEICANPSTSQVFDVKEEDSEICTNPSPLQAFDKAADPNPPPPQPQSASASNMLARFSMAMSAMAQKRNHPPGPQPASDAGPQRPYYTIIQEGSKKLVLVSNKTLSTGFSNPTTSTSTRQPPNSSRFLVSLPIHPRQGSPQSVISTVNKHPNALSPQRPPGMFVIASRPGVSQAKICRIGGLSTKPSQPQLSSSTLRYVHSLRPQLSTPPEQDAVSSRIVETMTVHHGSRFRTEKLPPEDLQNPHPKPLNIIQSANHSVMNSILAERMKQTRFSSTRTSAVNQQVVNLQSAETVRNTNPSVAKSLASQGNKQSLPVLVKIITNTNLQNTNASMAEIDDGGASNTNTRTEKLSLGNLQGASSSNAGISPVNSLPVNSLPNSQILEPRPKTLSDITQSDTHTLSLSVPHTSQVHNIGSPSMRRASITSPSAQPAIRDALKARIVNQSQLTLSSVTQSDKHTLSAPHTAPETNAGSLSLSKLNQCHLDLREALNTRKVNQSKALNTRKVNQSNAPESGQTHGAVGASVRSDNTISNTEYDSLICFAQGIASSTQNATCTTSPGNVKSKQPATASVNVKSKQPATASVNVKSKQPATAPGNMKSQQPVPVSVNMKSKQPATAPGNMKSQQPVPVSVNMKSQQPVPVSVNMKSQQPATATGNMKSQQPVPVSVNMKSQQPATAPGNMKSQQPATAPGNMKSQQPVTATGNMKSQQPVPVSVNMKSQQPVPVSVNMKSQQPATAPGNMKSQQPVPVSVNTKSQQPATAPGNMKSQQPATAPGNMKSKQPATAPGNMKSQQPVPVSVNMKSQQPATAPGNMKSQQPATAPGNMKSQQPVTATQSDVPSASTVTGGASRLTDQSHRNPQTMRELLTRLYPNSDPETTKKLLAKLNRRDNGMKRLKQSSISAGMNNSGNAMQKEHENKTSGKNNEAPQRPQREFTVPKIVMPEPKDIPRRDIRCLQEGCGKRFHTTWDFFRHRINLHPVAPILCNYCDLVFPSFSEYGRHEDHLHKDPSGLLFSCSKCNKQFLFRHRLTTHVRTHTRTDENPSENRKWGYRYHMRRKSTGIKQYECKECGKNFCHAISLERHARYHSGDKPYQCRACKRKFIHLPNLRFHMENSCTAKSGPGDNVDNDIGVSAQEKLLRPWQCSDCGQRFKLQGILRRHLFEETLPCSVCSETFTSFCKLKLHRASHDKMLCSECGKVFQNKILLESHMRTHTGEKPFKCQECGKAFSQSGSLKVHRRMHTGEKTYKCSKCGEMFLQRYTLRHHLRKHRNENSQKAEDASKRTCTVCGFVCSQTGGLRVHMRTHTGEKPHRCSVEGCGKGFTQRNGLTQHMRTHTGEKPFTCDECGRQFSQNTGLKSHKKIYHSKTSDKKSKSKDGEEDEIDSSS